MSGGRQSGPAMRGPRGIKGGPKAKNPIQTLKRILGIVLKGYPVHCVFVVIGIVVSVLANVRGSLFLRTLIDDYIYADDRRSFPGFRAAFQGAVHDGPDLSGGRRLYLSL